jgi:hypothetical protein
MHLYIEELYEHYFRAIYVFSDLITEVHSAPRQCLFWPEISRSFPHTRNQKSREIILK